MLHEWVEHYNIHSNCRKSTKFKERPKYWISYLSTSENIISNVSLVTVYISSVYFHSGEADLNSQTSACLHSQRCGRISTSVCLPPAQNGKAVKPVEFPVPTVPPPGLCCCCLSIVSFQETDIHTITPVWTAVCCPVRRAGAKWRCFPSQSCQSSHLGKVSWIIMK